MRTSVVARRGGTAKIFPQTAKGLAIIHHADCTVSDSLVCLAVCWRVSLQQLVHNPHTTEFIKRVACLWLSGHV